MPMLLLYSICYSSDAKVYRSIATNQDLVGIYSIHFSGRSSQYIGKKSMVS